MRQEHPDQLELELPMNKPEDKANPKLPAWLRNRLICTDAFGKDLALVPITVLEDLVAPKPVATIALKNVNKFLEDRGLGQCVSDPESLITAVQAMFIVYHETMHKYFQEK